MDKPSVDLEVQTPVVLAPGSPSIVDLPVPSDELAATLNPDTIVQIEEVEPPKAHFSNSYRRC